VRRPYVIGTQRCNGRPGLEVYSVQFLRPNGRAPSTDLSSNGSLRPNGYLAVTTSSVSESAFARLHARFRVTWTRYALL
jgi:hypothetical protein